MSKITKVLIHSFITNIILSLIKIVSGIIGASGALVADGIHSLSDTITDVFAIIGHKLSMKPADREHPFGHGKMEYLTCVVIGLVIMAMGLTIVYSGIFNEPVIPSVLTAVIGIIVIVAKLVLSRYILKRGTEYDSNILIASGKESFTDVISSVIVLVSILLAQLGKINSLFTYADMIAMVIVGILILKIAYNILRENFSNLLGKQVIDSTYIGELEKIILNESEIKGIESLIVLKYGPIYQVNLEVLMEENIVLKDAHDILDMLEEKLKKHDSKIQHIIIHVSPDKC
ncbi:MAG: cation transporter [Bacilli bacterium]|nr:cation transporter [Bacilli bacterium]